MKLGNTFEKIKGMHSIINTPPCIKGTLFTAVDAYIQQNKKTEGIHKRDNPPPLLKKGQHLTVSNTFFFLKLTNFSKTRKNGQSKYLPRSHLVYLKVIKARNSLML